MAAPGDTELLYRYARQAVTEGDFEGAVATLERVLDLDPASVEARIDLAAAYFALGADDVALYHLNVLKGSGALTPAQHAKVAEYETQAQSRNAPSAFSGFAEAGIAMSGENDKVGGRASFGFKHVYDFGGANGTVFISTLRADYLDLGSAVTAGQKSIAATFGPSFRLANKEYGPTLRPYVSARSTDDDLINEDRDLFGLGLSFETPVSSVLSLFATFEDGEARYDTANLDGDYRDGQLGLVWMPDGDTRVTASVLRREVDIVDPSIESDLQAVRLDFEKRIAPSFARHDWVLSGFVQTEREDFTIGREDKVDRIGAAVQAFLSEDLYINGEVQYFDRSSYFFGFEAQEPLVSLSAGMEF